MSRALPRTNGAPERNTGRRAVGLIVSLLLLAPMAAPAHADEYDDRRENKEKISQQRQVIASSKQTVARAVEAANRAADDLILAQIALEQATTDRQAAAAHDEEMAALLIQRQDELRQAEAIADAAAAKVVDERSRIGSVAVSVYQQHGQLSSLAVLTTAGDASQFSDRLQWNTQMMETHENAYRDLQASQQQAARAQQARSAAADAAQDARSKAGAALAKRQQTEQTQAREEARVADLSAKAEAAQAKAMDELAKDEATLEDLKAESKEIEKAIAERIKREEAIRKAKAEAARKAKLEQQRKAKEEAARQKRLAEERRLEEQRRSAREAQRIRDANRKAERQAELDRQAAERQRLANEQQARVDEAKREEQAAAPTPSPMFIRPVPGPKTSGFGMRIHPVLGTWMLHNGTDYGAACGTPVVAAADGTVSSATTWGGYGQQVQIDHYIDGYVYTTLYAHLSAYAVGQGQQVKQGQVIGYIGSTGRSTGCHLHLVVFRNGELQNADHYF